MTSALGWVLAVNPVPWARAQMAFTLAFHIVLVPLGGQASWPLSVDGTFWPGTDGEAHYFATRLGVAVKTR